MKERTDRHVSENAVMRRLASPRGTTYVEYFLVATGMALATVWLVNQVTQMALPSSPYSAVFNSQASQIRGGM